MVQTVTKLSENILIPCPKKQFALRKAKHCFLCEFYNGIVRATERGTPIHSDDPEFLQILCARPISRKLIKVID